MKSRSLSILFSLASVFLLTHCGQDHGVEGVLSKIFIMDTGKQDQKVDGLSKEFIESLNIEIDDEHTVSSHLRELEDKEFNLEKNQSNVLTALHYIMTIIKRSEFVPDFKRSQCQCKYSNATYIEATDALGSFLVKMYKNEKVSELNKDNPEIYQEAYRQFTLGKELLEDLTKIDPGLHAKSTSERDDLSQLKTKALSYLKQLSETPPQTEDKKTPEK